MNHHQTNDYVVDLDKIYEQLGFSRKDPAKRIIEKNFTENSDYKVYGGGEAKPAPQLGGAGINEANRNLGGSGQNREKIMLNVDTFKKLHLKFKPFPITFERKRYLQFIYENFTFTDDNQWPLSYLIMEKYMKYEKIFYSKTDLKEIKMLLNTLCSGCVFK